MCILCECWCVRVCACTNVCVENAKGGVPVKEMATYPCVYVNCVCVFVCARVLCARVCVSKQRRATCPWGKWQAPLCMNMHAGYGLGMCVCV